MNAPASAPTQHPDDIWDLFTVKTRYAPPEITDPAHPARQYQLLEVVVARLMSLLRPEYRWEVTQVSGDGGIDFIGRCTLIELPEFDLRGEDVVTGQCKRTRRRIHPGQVLGWNFLQVGSLLPSQVIVAYAGRASAAQRNEVVDRARNELRRPVIFLGLDELDFLIRRHLPALRRIIEEALDEPDARRVLDHFAGSGPASLRPSCTVSAPDRGETGQPFEIVVEVRSEGIPL
ncbi:MAG: hypothetical protein ACJ8GN_23060, partial [Longimicrobiaceae bacterium]